MDKVREEFEKWILRKFHNRNYLNKDKDGFYTNLLTAGAWASWQEKQKRVDEQHHRILELDSRLSQSEIDKSILRNDCRKLLEDKQRHVSAALNHLRDVRNLGRDHSAYLAIKELEQAFKGGHQ